MFCALGYHRAYNKNLVRGCRAGWIEKITHLALKVLGFTEIGFLETQGVQKTELPKQSNYWKEKLHD